MVRAAQVASLKQQNAVLDMKLEGALDQVSSWGDERASLLQSFRALGCCDMTDEGAACAARVVPMAALAVPLRCVSARPGGRRCRSCWLGVGSVTVLTQRET